MPILTDDLREKQKIVNQYKIGHNKFKEGTPDHVIEWDKEIAEFYRKESEGVM